MLRAIYLYYGIFSLSFFSKTFLLSVQLLFKHLFNLFTFYSTKKILWIQLNSSAV